MSATKRSLLRRNGACMAAIPSSQEFYLPALAVCSVPRERMPACDSRDRPVPGNARTSPPRQTSGERWPSSFPRRSTLVRMVASVIEPAGISGSAARIALIDVDGVLLNQNREGIYDSGENPVASFHEKLEAAAADARVAAVRAPDP